MTKPNLKPQPSKRPTPRSMREPRSRSSSVSSSCSASKSWSVGEFGERCALPGTTSPRMQTRAQQTSPREPGSNPEAPARLSSAKRAGGPVWSRLLPLYLATAAIPFTLFLSAHKTQRTRRFST